jgi:predicted  nucleic acid-binding Zn-ribbon protein
MKQILERLPDNASLEAAFDLLRYENAAQQSRIAKLEAEMEDLLNSIREKDAVLETQQEFIDLLNAELHALREAG